MTEQFTDAELDALAATAGKATSGPWEHEVTPIVPSELGKGKFPDGLAGWVNHRVVTAWIHGQAKSKIYIGYKTTSPYTEPIHDFQFDRGDAAHIAAFDPPTALRLIAELKEARVRIAELEEQLKYPGQSWRESMGLHP